MNDALSSGRRQRGFETAASLLRERIRSAGESRGFAVSRVLTHWAEIAGEDIARHCVPVKVGYGKGGLGATLTLLTTGSAAPVLQMQLPALRDRINACYGYSAIARIHITQTAAEGFAEGQAAFAGAPRRTRAEPSPAVAGAAARLAAPVSDPDLRAALDRLARNVLSRTERQRGKDE